MIRLECTRGGSNKYYELHLTESQNHIIVTGFYGAIGQAPKEHPIYDGDNREDAIASMQKKQLEKQKKGYIVVGNGAGPAPAEKKNNELPIIWPMNALGVRNADHLEQLFADPDFVAQEKLDGMRAIVHVTPAGLRIFSRSAGVDDPTRPLEKTSALPHLAKLKFPNLVGTILDTEILLPGVDSAVLSGTVHRKNTNGDEKRVKIFVFDVLQSKGEDLTGFRFESRMIHLAKMCAHIRSRYIYFLSLAYAEPDKRNLYDSILKARGEGVIFKRLDASYVQGGRPSNNWYKAKRSATFDCIVLGFTKGAGKFNNRIGAVRFGQYIEDTLVELGQASGMSDAVRTDMSIHPEKYIGRVVTIKGMERLKSGAIRHPQFAGMRLDKKPQECIWYKGEQ